MQALQITGREFPISQTGIPRRFHCNAPKSFPETPITLFQIFSTTPDPGASAQKIISDAGGFENASPPFLPIQS
jgi:hypothetical protein